MVREDKRYVGQVRGRNDRQTAPKHPNLEELLAQRKRQSGGDGVLQDLDNADERRTKANHKARAEVQHTAIYEGTGIVLRLRQKLQEAPQRTQYPLIKEYSLNHIMKPLII